MKWSKLEGDKSLPSVVRGDLPPRLNLVVLYITEISIILACVPEILTTTGLITDRESSRMD
jgi:hypothetical protein